MDRKATQILIENTFNYPFDEDRFRYFTINLLANLDKEKDSPYISGKYIKDFFREHIHKYRRIGTYIAPDGDKLDVLVVHLVNPWALERSRTMLRNFTAWYLKNQDEKDAALVAYHTDDLDDWRFSFVRMEYRQEITEKGTIKVKEEFTPARRYSYLVGKNEPNHTAQEQMIPILEDDQNNPTLANIEEAFSVDAVTKQFYEDYRALFEKLTNELNNTLEKDNKIKEEFEDNYIDTANFAKKLMGQIVFLYFLQKKGWLGVSKDSQGNFKQWGTGPKNFMKRLFNKEFSDYKNFFNDILEPLFYNALNNGDRRSDYYEKLDCKIPFLDGGLFEPMNDYDWVETEIRINNDILEDILKTFDRYNFTVREDEPLDKEVAVDPEMLGKVFENLLEENLRKGKGAYYTPRPIVHYMCQESLVNYLSTECEGIVPKKDIEKLIHEGEAVFEIEAAIEEGNKNHKRQLPKSVVQNAALIDKKLADIKVCDPAIGSGAFPVGMMNEIIKARMGLDAFLKSGETIYNFKRHCIQESIFGVDINPGAIEIAKLRLWLSLVVDEDDYETIQPLPNLDFKIMQGNSLTEAFHGISLSLEKKQEQLELGEDIKELDWLIEELDIKQKRFFNAIHPREKQQCRRDVEKNILDIFHHYIEKKREFNQNEADEIESELMEMTHGNKERPFFPWKLYFADVFREKGGFDVMIANPPYIEHKKLKKYSQILKSIFEVYSGTADLYVYFFEKALNLLHTKGTLCFITSNKFMKTRYGANLRHMLTQNLIHKIVDFSDIHVFDALVSSCVMVVSKAEKTGNEITVAIAKNQMLIKFNIYNYVQKEGFNYLQSKLDNTIWNFEDEATLNLKDKIEKIGERLININGVKIFRGITTGYNLAFIIDERTKNLLIKEYQESNKIIKSLLQGRNIRKWIPEESHSYLLLTEYNLDIPTLYSNVFRHLEKHKEHLVERADQGKNWWNLRACKYYSEFEKEKIIWGLTADKWSYAYDNKNHFLPSNGYILTSKFLSIKYILANLNSKLHQFYFRIIGIMTAGGAYTLKHETLSAFPVAVVNKNNQRPFISLVDRILSSKRTNPHSDISFLEAKIDRLVYKLYGLTENEIAIVEESIEGRLSER